MLTTQKSLCHAECCCMVNVVLLHPIENLSVSRNGCATSFDTALETSTAAFVARCQLPPEPHGEPPIRVLVCCKKASASTYYAYT